MDGRDNTGVYGPVKSTRREATDSQVVAGEEPEGKFGGCRGSRGVRVTTGVSV